MLVSLEISMLILFPKLEPPWLQRWLLVPLPCYFQNSLHSVSQMETSHFNIPPPTSTVPFLQFLRWNWSSHAPYALISAVAFKVKASYNRRKSVVRKTLPAALAKTCYKTLIIFFLTVLLLSLYANLSLALQSARWSVAQLLSLRSSVASPSLVRSWVAPPFNQAASKIKTMR